MRVRVSTVTWRFQHCFRSPVSEGTGQPNHSFFSFKPNSSMEHVPIVRAHSAWKSHSLGSLPLCCSVHLKKSSRFCAVDKQFLEHAILLNTLWSKPDCRGVCVDFGLWTSFINWAYTGNYLSKRKNNPVHQHSKLIVSLEMKASSCWNVLGDFYRTPKPITIWQHSAISLFLLLCPHS